MLDQLTLDSPATRATMTAQYNLAVRPGFVDAIASLGIDVIFHRAAGAHLFFHDDQNVEQRVLDLVGGYGSNLLGHNHPRLISTARRMLAGHVPMHAQRSIRPYAAELSRLVNAKLRAETGQDYVYCFGNGGAEANETAIKHALYERQHLQDAAREDAVRLSEEQRAHNEHVLGLPLSIVAVADGFHGKSVAALAASHSDGIKPRILGNWIPTLHFPHGAPDAARRTLDAQTHALWHPTPDGVIRVPYSPVVALLCEPIIGDGGVIEVSSAFLREIRDWTTATRVPLVFDEIQSGAGRTGTYLASAASGVTADYYTLSKSLSGGVGKVSVCAVASSRFRPTFALVHSSTYNEDDFSSALAITALAVCEEEGLYECAVAIGERYLAGLRGIQARHPRIVADVRGRGLMLGVEWTAAAAAALPGRHLAQQIESYLFTQHRVRVGTAISSPRITRLAPPAVIDDSDIDDSLDALEDVCGWLERA